MEIQEMVRCTIMRGGTSKGIFFHLSDLPQEPGLRDKVIRRVFGAPDFREIDGNAKLLQRIEKIRSVAAQTMGLCKDWRKATGEVPYSPFIALCAPPMNYPNWTTGKVVAEKSVDIVVRLLFMQKMHRTYPVTGTVCTVAAAMIPGTIVNQLARREVVARGEVRIGHPAGVITPEGKVVREKGSFVLKRATVDRTARCLIRGYAYIPKSTLK